MIGNVRADGHAESTDGDRPVVDVEKSGRASIARVVAVNTLDIQLRIKARHEEALDRLAPINQALTADPQCAYLRIACEVERTYECGRGHGDGVLSVACKPNVMLTKALGVAALSLVARVHLRLRGAQIGRVELHRGDGGLRGGGRARGVA